MELSSATQNGLNHRFTFKILWYFQNEIFTVTRLLDSSGKDSSTKFCWSLHGKRSRIWNVCFIIEEKIILMANVDDSKKAGQKQNMAPMWKKLMKNVGLDEPIPFLDYN